LYIHVNHITKQNMGSDTLNIESNGDNSIGSNIGGKYIMEYQCSGN